jgi:abhydrolase domain-containing protein 17
VYAYLINEKGISPHQIVLYGRSLGSGPSCWLARKTARDGSSVGGLILHSPFESVYRVVLNLGFTMAGDKFPNIDNIREVSCPVFICHGTEDDVVPCVHGMDLQNAVPGELRTKPFWMEDVGHNDHGPEVEAELIRKITHYLDYYIIARRLYLKPPQSRLTSSPKRMKRRPMVIPRREV